MTNNDVRAEDAFGLEDDIVRIHLQSLGYVLSRAHHLVREKLVASLEGTGLHMGHIVILASLRAQSLLQGESDLTQTRISRVTGIEKSSLVLFLDALEKEGWVERRRHPNDRRAYIIHLTATGSERFNRVGEQLKESEDDCLSVFSADERQQLSNLLLRLVAHLDSEQESQDSPASHPQETDA